MTRSGDEIQEYGTGRTRNFDEISLLSLVNFMLRHRRLLVVLPVLAAVVVGSLNMTRPRTWTSSAAFIAQQPGLERSELAGLAAQFGVALGAGESGHSPAFYVQLLRSRTMLEPLALTEFELDRGRKARLVDIYPENEGSAAERMDATLRRLRRYVTPNSSRESGIIHLDVKAPTPLLAELKAARVLELLNEFNVQLRQSQARAEREFAGERLAEVRSEQQAAERAMQAFLQGNRQWRTSPELVFRHERLEREVVSRSQLANALEQRFEQARIDEVRVTPLITLVEAPSRPVRPDARGTVGRAVLAGVAGLLLALLIAILREVPERAARDQEEEYARFMQLRREAMRDLALGLRHSPPPRRLPERVGPAADITPTTQGNEG
jgi:uncharacterized protein involved in exopolysaccharide biosynthesis